MSQQTHQTQQTEHSELHETRPLPVAGPAGEAPAAVPRTPSGLRYRVLGLRGVAAVALASVIVGGAGGLALGRLGNGADSGTGNGPGGRFQPGQQNGFPGQTGQTGQQGQNGFPGQTGQNGFPGGVPGGTTQNGVPGGTTQNGVPGGVPGNTGQGSTGQGSTGQGTTTTSAWVRPAAGASRRGPRLPRIAPAPGGLPPATEPRPATRPESA